MFFSISIILQYMESNYSLITMKFLRFQCFVLKCISCCEGATLKRPRIELQWTKFFSLKKRRKINTWCVYVYSHNHQHSMFVIVGNIHQLTKLTSQLIVEQWVKSSNEISSCETLFRATKIRRIQILQYWERQPPHPHPFFRENR